MMTKKPTEETEKLWIRTTEQLTQAEKRQRSVDIKKIVDFLINLGYKTIKVGLDNKNRKILCNSKTGNPIALTENQIDELAKRLGLLSGKWMIFEPELKINNTWAIIANLCEKEKIWSAKVSTKTQQTYKVQEYVICVYTKNYLDEEDVFIMREILRQNGSERTLYYKPDIYTILHIYSDNKHLFKLRRSSRYSA